MPTFSSLGKSQRLWYLLPFLAKNRKKWLKIPKKVAKMRFFENQFHRVWLGKSIKNAKK